MEVSSAKIHANHLTDLGRPNAETFHTVEFRDSVYIDTRLMMQGIIQRHQCTECRSFHTAIPSNNSRIISMQCDTMVWACHSH